MRLGFHYHVPARLDDRRIRMPGFQGRFVDSLATYCSEVVCFLHSPSPNDRFLMDYVLEKSNVRLVDLGVHSTVPRRVLSIPRYARTLRSYREHLDALLLRGPSPLLPTFADAVRPLPTALLLVGDAVANVDDSRQPFWRRQLIRLFWLWNRHRQNAIAAQSLTFVNSRKLLREMQSRVPRLVETRTTTLRREDFFVREDTCLRPPYHLLYAGRLTRGKGLIEMVEALGRLVDLGEDVCLDLVGWPEKGDGVLQEVEQVVSRLQLTERFRYHGPKCAGPELYTYYREADLFVLASQSSEGFPRTIWEAMAHSLPVVATKVGSIPDLVQDAALLVAPNSIDELARALRYILHQPAKRRILIERGRQLAAEATLERQSAAMIQHLQGWAAPVQ
jgi:glycosyltransferase involved in cell wall biosynthesis